MPRRAAGLAWAVYRISREAENDLYAIYLTSVADFGTDQAERYQGSLEQSFDFLAEHPRAARERLEISPPIRVFRHRSHIILYRIDDEDIVILRIRHGREDWMNRD